MRIPLLALAVLALACASAPSPRQREAAEIHTNLGLEALRAGRGQDAMREFDLALAQDDSIAETHLGRGLVLEFTYQRREEAEAAYRKAIALKPSLSEAHNNLGQLLAGKGRLEEAVRQFDEALSNMYYPEPYVARCNKGLALYKLGRKEDGLAELRTCLTLNPRFCLGHRELGRIRLEEGRVRDAVQSFESFTQQCDKVPDAWYQLGLARIRSGDPEKAREALGRCADLAGAAELGTECRRLRDQLQ